MEVKRHMVKLSDIQTERYALKKHIMKLRGHKEPGGLKGCVTMSEILVEGGSSLRGEITVQGAKNSALPILAAALLCDSPSVIHNCPDLSDVEVSCDILRCLGCEVRHESGSVYIDPAGMDKSEIPEKLMREMRSSIVFLGAICARLGNAHISAPGGCELGPRPIDLHIKALRQLGLKIQEDHGWLTCDSTDGLHGSEIVLSFPSVGATENVMLAAATAKGTTTVVNAAREPEIEDLADFLCRCGAKITGAGQSIINIEGVASLHGCEHSVIPDRIVAATYMAAAAITGGELELKSVNLRHLSPILPVFTEAGCAISAGDDSLIVRRTGRLKPVKYVRTMPYPGFPTDAQALVMAMSTMASGTSIFIENIFENRYKHVAELERLGAKISVEGRVAVVEGVKTLRGASVEATDLRGGAALVIAALAAEGQTVISGINHIDRGYAGIEKILTDVGASIRRR